MAVKPKKKVPKKPISNTTKLATSNTTKLATSKPKEKPCVSKPSARASAAPSPSSPKSSSLRSSAGALATSGTSSVDEEIDPLEKFRHVSEVGTSLANKDLPNAPIPTGPIHKSQVRDIPEEEMEELLKLSPFEMSQRAIHMLGGVDYLIRVGLYDHKTLLGYNAKLAPKDIQVGPTSSFLELVIAANKIPLPPRPEPRDITPEEV